MILAATSGHQPELNLICVSILTQINISLSHYISLPITSISLSALAAYLTLQNRRKTGFY